MYAQGTIIQRPLSGRLGTFYNHVGIYIGKNRVIHFNGTRLSDGQAAEIRLDSLENFADGHPVSIRLPPRDRRHGQWIVRYARQLRRQQNNPYNHRYHFIFRNCEDFCRHCYRAALASAQEQAAPLPHSQRGRTIIRLGRALSMGYAGARLGRLAGPYGIFFGAVAGGLAGILLAPDTAGRDAQADTE